MRYFVKMNTGGESWRLTVRFEEKKDGIHAFLKREDDGPETEIPVDACFLENGRSLHMIYEKESHNIILDPSDRKTAVLIHGDWLELEILDERDRIAMEVAGARKGQGGAVRASMPGVVVRVDVEEGQEVSEGDTLCVVEAMKMQNPITAESSGVVRRVHIAKGDAVAGGDVLVSLGS